MLSGYRIMWLMVMFDLPVLTPKERKQASDFRNGLLDLGFEMQQFSVYLRCCPSYRQTETYSQKIVKSLPSGGKVSIIQITDKQLERVQSFQGGSRKKQLSAPGQFELF